MANRFWVGPAGNYNSTNWATTSGGTTGQAAPTSSDAVTFDGAGATGNSNCTITAAAAALTVTFSSGYTSTITINATFTLTVAGSFTDNTAHTWTVNSTDIGALTISAASTITSNGKTFPGNVSFTNTNTKTLSGNWTITGGLTLAGGTTFNSNTISCVGLTPLANTLGGTATIQLTGGTWSGAFNIRNNVTLAGNVTISGTVNYGTNTLAYSSGTVTTSGSTLTLTAACTLNTNGVTWNNITLSAITSTITISSLLSVSGTFTMPASSVPTFAGIAGFSVATLVLGGTGNLQIVTLANTVTYTITTAFTCTAATVAQHPLITSDHATNKAILTLNNGASNNLICDFTRIDASNGRTIWSFNGVITTCNNINSFTDMGAIQQLNQKSAVGWY